MKKIFLLAILCVYSGMGAMNPEEIIRLEAELCYNRNRLADNSVACQEKSLLLARNQEILQHMRSLSCGQDEASCRPTQAMFDELKARVTKLESAVNSTLLARIIKFFRG